MMPMSLDELHQRVAAVRAFNRFWTTRIGVLDATHLGTEFSLAEARLLFELADRDEGPGEVTDVRRRLELDAGYLSRLLADFRAKKLVTTSASKEDARRQTVRLTAKGRRAAAELDARAVDHVTNLLTPLADEEQRQMLGALAGARRLLERDTRASDLVLRPPRPGDLGWVVERHGALYAHEYGWDERFEGLVASIVADYAEARDPRTAAWIAEVGGERAGCIFCTKKNASTAQLRLLLVDPRFRAHGVGGRLVGECVRFARANGYRRLVLWTNSILKAARVLYERAGFSLIESKKHNDFGPVLTGQTWELNLRSHEALPPRA